MTIAALAPAPPVLVVGAILVGVGAGSFLAVDWALMTDIIPKASSGRYMGISNVATATNGVVSTFAGGLIIDSFVRLGTPEVGPAHRVPARPDLAGDRGVAAATGRRTTARGRCPAAGTRARGGGQPGAGRLSRARASATQTRQVAGRRKSNGSAFR